MAAPLHVAEEYQPAALHAMACAQPGAAEFLPKLLTAFEESAGPQRKKVVISAVDSDQAIRWIALGSLFLDLADVLELSFRVFTEAPLEEDLSIAVFHPGLTRSAPVIEALPEALNGIDLATFRSSPITPSESATTYSRWFLEYDAFDSLEAIELGRRWQPHLASPALATTMAGIVCLGRPAGPDMEVTDIAEALAAVSAHEPDDMDEYGAVLAEAVLSIKPAASDDPAALHGAVVVLSRNRHHEAAETVALALLEGARLYPDTYGVRWARAVHRSDAADKTRVRWTSSDSQQRAMRLLVETLAAAADSALAPLFEVIPSLGLGVRWAAVQEHGARLVRYWCTHPDAVDRAGNTAFYAELEAQLWPELETRVRTGDEIVRRAMTAGEWSWLRASADPGNSSSAVTAALTAAAVAAAPPEQRGALLTGYLRTATAPDWTLFFPARRRPEPELLGVWVTQDRAALQDPAFAELVDSAIDKEIARDSVELLEQIAHLDGLPEPLAGVAREYARTHRILRALGDMADEIPNPVLEDLETVDHRFRYYYRAAIASHLLVQNDLAGVSRYLSATRSYELRDHFYYRTTEQLQHGLRDFAHRLLYLCEADETSAWMRGDVKRAFGDWLRKPANKRRALDAARHLDRHHSALWNALVQQLSDDRQQVSPQSRKLLSMNRFRKGQH
ncbi:GAP1-M domain-containing protein [Nocardia jiangsuensis]|uniref:GTPase-associated protein 1 middle domain-containing protein n=1 Tax=Nocardia jiangsuensis TaxID=1691563 RepID=A0ABV8E2P1_9NOCA